MARKTKAEAQETRHLLLDAATRVFSERGVARTTLQDVASAAGMTRGAVYWHFKDKPDLFNAMMDRVVLPWEEAHEALLSHPPDDPLQTLGLLAMEPLQRLETAPDVQQVLLIAMHFTEYTDELAAVRVHQQATADNYVGEMQRLFAEAAAAGRLRPGVVPQAAACGLHALVEGLMRQWVLRPESFGLAETGGVAVAAYLAGAARGDSEPLNSLAAGTLRTAPALPAAAAALRASTPAAPAAAPRRSRARPAPST